MLGFDAEAPAGDWAPASDDGEEAPCDPPEDASLPDDDEVCVWLGDELDWPPCDCDVEGVDCGMLDEEVDCEAQEASSRAPIRAIPAIRPFRGACTALVSGLFIQ